MGPLRVVYNVASNKPPRYRDHVGSEDSGISSPANTDLDIQSDPDDHLLPANPNEPLLPTSEEPPQSQHWPEPVAQHIPTHLRRLSRAVVKWVKGPQPPRPWSITPLFPKLQRAPIKLLDTYAPEKRQRFCLLLTLYLGWILSFSLTLQKSAAASEVPGYGPPMRLSCGDSFWSDKNGCGVDGINCRPFTNDTFVFRCPANCIKTQVLEPHAVGAQEIVYRPLIIGGPPSGDDDISHAIYRGDSFICGAAIHAGFISNEEGGCGVLSLVGEHTDYPSTRRNGMSSIAFDSTFPRSFAFLPGTRSPCRDLRWPLLAITVTFTTILSLFTTSPTVFLASIFTALFFHVALASDPPNAPTYTSLLSLAVSRFLPAAFTISVLHHTTIRHTLHHLSAQLEKTLLWLGAAWLGALNNYTFDRIPIQRLTPHDLHAQPGAIPALIGIVLSIFAIALGQAWALRVAGLMPRYLAVYAILCGSLLLLLAVPQLHLRIHHYILALLLLPGTALQNRPSLLYQGLLVGLFINGIARWGFDSLLQTDEALLGDGWLGSLLPNITTPVVAGAGTAAANITFSWGALPVGYDGVSVLVNDVERFRGYSGGGGWDGWRDSFTWTRHTLAHPEYFRFGYVTGSVSHDYTRAGTWLSNDSWNPMVPGPS